MRNGAVAVLLVVIIALSAGAGYLVGVSIPRNQTSASTTTTSTNTSTSEICTEVGNAIGVRLRVVESTYQYPNETIVPVSGATVNGAWVLYCNGQLQPQEFGPFHTNSSGWVDLSYGGGGYYYLNVSLPSSPLVIPFSVPVEPGLTTYATVNLSTGNVTTHFCGFLENCPTTSHPYQVEFVQESNCPYESLIVPWGVVMNHQTVTQPSNATLPLSYAATHLTSNSMYSTIWFSLPNGTYAYSILPNNFYGQEVSGNVTIDGRDVVVQVTAFITAMGCSISTTIGG